MENPDVESAKVRLVKCQDGRDLVGECSRNQARIVSLQTHQFPPKTIQLLAFGKRWKAASIRVVTRSAVTTSRPSPFRSAGRVHAPEFKDVLRDNARTVAVRFEGFQRRTSFAIVRVPPIDTSNQNVGIKQNIPA